MDKLIIFLEWYSTLSFEIKLLPVIIIFALLFTVVGSRKSSIS